MKQLKGIKEKLIENLRQRAAEVNIPEVVREMFEEGTIRQAGQWRARLGWRGIVDHANPMGAENLSLRDARRALDLDYYGQKDAKSRILELLAVGTLQGFMQGKIIHLVGPSGMGRKRTGKSMADALGRRFFRFLIGGLTDVEEIKDHRRTYVG